MKSSKKKVCTYVNNNTNYTKHIPQHLQRLMIEKYCKLKRLEINTEILEYNNMAHLPLLDHLINTRKFSEIVIFSIQSINVNKKFINNFVKNIKKMKKKNIHFANEGIELSSKKTLQIIENLLR